MKNHRTPRTTPRTKRSRRGYTVIEVMMAMTLFAIGAAGVISMQKVTIQGGTDARRFDIASNLANEWLYRLQRDSMYWTKPNASTPAAENLTTDTRWIKLVSTSTWQKPPIPAASPGGLSPAFDVLGRDMGPGPGHFFCTEIRLQWVADPGAGFAAVGAIMRAEVRVFWSRLELAPIDDCSAPAVAPDAANAPKVYHFVYATTAIRSNPLP